MTKIDRSLTQDNIELLANLGYLDGVTYQRVFGSNPDMGTSGTAYDMIETSGDVYFLPSAQVVHFSSTLIGDAGKEIFIEGLDANWVYQSETVTLDATNPTTTTAPTLNTYIRINTICNNNSTLTVGDIYVGDTTSVTVGVPNGNVLISFAVEHQLSKNGHYSVPIEHYGMICHMYGNSGRGFEVEFDLIVREFGKVFRSLLHFAVYQSQGTLDLNYVRIPPKSDIKIRGTADGNNAHAIGSLCILQIHENKVNV